MRSSSAGEDLSKLPGEPVVRLDVQEPESIDKAIKDGLARFGRIVALVNNAGFGFDEQDGWDWNVAGDWQWGSFGQSRIQALTASLYIGFELAATYVPFEPDPVLQQRGGRGGDFFGAWVR